MTGESIVSGLHDCIINSLTSGVLAVGSDGRVLVVNRAARTFLNASETELRPGDRLDSIATTQPLWDLFEEVYRSREPVTRREVVLQLADSVKKEIGLSASLLQGQSSCDGVIFLFTDLTQRRRLEQAADLNRQLAALGELTAGVVHELRNPVSVISGMAELLKRKLPDDDERRAAAETILQETTELERSISQFLGFARPYDMHRRWCKPESVARRALAFCHQRAHRKGVALECRCDTDVPRFYVDGDRIAQALANVLGNAVDAVAEGGTVFLHTRHEKDSLVFTVLDNGPGVFLREGENLFTAFFTQKEGGTGLGLTISYRIAAAHDGDIRYGNRPEGGAWFTLRIPVSQHAADDSGSDHS